MSLQRTDITYSSTEKRHSFVDHNPGVMKKLKTIRINIPNFEYFRTDLTVESGKKSGGKVFL